MLLSCPSCRGEMTAPDDTQPGQVFACPHCARQVPSPPPRSTAPRQGSGTVLHVAWVVFAILATLFGIMGVFSPAADSARSTVLALQAITLILAGYTVCRALERILGR